MLRLAYKSLRSMLSPARAVARMYLWTWRVPPMWVSFRTIEVYVAPGAVTPVKPSSLFVDLLVPMIKERNAKSLLEIGAGSGAIGLACRAETELEHIGLLDISPYAVASIRETLRRYPDPAVDVIVSDGLTAAPPKRYDLIVSNPPHGDAPAYTVFHRGGNDPGWQLHRNLFQMAHRHLTPNGRLVLFENGSPGYSTPETFTPMLKDSSLEIEAVVHLPSTVYVWYVIVLRARRP